MMIQSLWLNVCQEIDIERVMPTRESMCDTDLVEPGSKCITFLDRMYHLYNNNYVNTIPINPLRLVNGL